MRARRGLVGVIVFWIAVATACSDLGAGPKGEAPLDPEADASLSDADVPPDASKLAEAGVDADAAPPDVRDFHVPGTQMGDVDAAAYVSPAVCAGCHGGAFIPSAPHSTWKASLMANAGRDPLFFAQLATASQDVPGVGYYCLRCHVPMAVATERAAFGTEAALSGVDRDGVSCLFCHSMVDPLAGGADAVTGDQAILSALADPPKYYGNAAFVLDPSWLRRGPYLDAVPPHRATYSKFVERSEMCGTCHDVGNVRVARLADGTYQYVAKGQGAPNADPTAQFPLERTYTEWKLSAFANGGVDGGGVFGGDAGPAVMRTCQDCHMPRVSAQGCAFAGTRPTLARHELAGASSWVLRIIGKQYPAEVDPVAIAEGEANAVAMVQRAATLSLSVDATSLRVRVENRSGHKIPTGHIEGRRMWIGVVFTDEAGAVVSEAGKWDPATGDLDAHATTVFEMHVGLSPAAAAKTGLAAGVTTHMALADLVVKDNRIPPLGFSNSAYEAAAAGAVGATYADGQNWADVDFVLPPGARRARAPLWYQTVTREYVDALKSAGHSVAERCDAITDRRADRHLDDAERRMLSAAPCAA
jgi:hypothetical protein